ncbi:hypothetical protein [Sediminibacillus terrae]|uniref:hypothetical protein n=1 Tax=Sediminibacillus terrae TaxID=1562106 RepID=UPI00129643EA|nr:hypothetical protein [Sediminibacillus terrae]
MKKLLSKLNGENPHPSQVFQIIFTHGNSMFLKNIKHSSAHCLFGEDRYKRRTYINAQQIMGYSLLPDFPEEKERKEPVNLNEQNQTNVMEQPVYQNPPQIPEGKDEKSERAAGQPKSDIKTENNGICAFEDDGIISFPHEMPKKVQVEKLQAEKSSVNLPEDLLTMGDLLGKEDTVVQADSGKVRGEINTEKLEQHHKIPLNPKQPVRYKVNNTNGNGLIKDSGNFMRKT